MSEQQPEPQEGVTFYTSGLLSKWGFGDGDMLWDFTYDHNLEVSGSALLREAVKRFVIPQITDTLDVVQIGTIHNPIRTRSVNGKEVDWFNPDDQTKISPESVTVPVADLIALANEMEKAYAPE